MNEVNMREVLEQATMFVGINKITRKNTKLFNKRLKILRFAGLHIFDHVKLSDIEEHIDLSTDAKKMSPSDFKNTVWASMEEGAEILESQDTSSDQNEQVEQQD